MKRNEQAPRAASFSARYKAALKLLDRQGLCPVGLKIRPQNWPGCEIEEAGEGGPCVRQDARPCWDKLFSEEATK